MPDPHPAHATLEGTVTALSLVQAPLSGLPCVLYQVELTGLQRLLEAWAGSGGACQETAGVRFIVRLETQLVLVDPSAACCRLPLRRRARVRLGRDVALDARLEALYGRLHRTPPAVRSVACRERRLQAGDRVVLSGVVTGLPDPRGAWAGYRSPPLLPLLVASAIMVAGA